MKECCFHPREMVVGVCALCLNEKLLVLAAASKKQTNTFLPKIFASSHILKHHKSHTPQDSFISIKFEANGVASWDKGKTSDEKTKSVIEHTSSLRWRRRIGNLLHLINRKRPAEGHVSTRHLEREKVKYGWIRILTKKRAKE
ncbi:hypothetical protein SASPL_104196 [Salvia splendens]|uniref:Uncharacterized protein n=1 Tax=Salvia splendens TaxID=180675 RepID=A0A8X8YGR2_SALSN|nr:uncharacterized protein LOC121786236 [Salvia splendens]KAG6432615.1 hypothetical protein SASPL_104196 [Salvia splendens]